MFRTLIIRSLTVLILLNFVGFIINLVHKMGVGLFIIITDLLEFLQIPLFLYLMQTIRTRGQFTWLLQIFYYQCTVRYKVGPNFEKYHPFLKNF